MSDPVKRDPVLDQFSVITRPFIRPNGLKTIPFPAHSQSMGVSPREEVKQAKAQETKFFLFLAFALVLASTFLVKTEHEARARNVIELFFNSQSKYSF